MDAYDKLTPYGIAISGCIDGFSRKIIWLRVGRTASNPKVIAGYYIQAVKDILVDVRDAYVLIVVLKMYR